MTLTIALPLPPEVLHPNGRTRKPGYRAACVRQYRQAAHLATQAVMFQSLPRCAKASVYPWPAASVLLHYSLPRRRDNDGLVAWCKAALDGIADAGVVANDSHFGTPQVEQVTGNGVRPGLEVVLTRKLC